MAGATAIDAALLKPRLRGVLHEWAFYASLVTGIVLVVLADGAAGHLVATLYALSVSGVLGVSALYHRVSWSAAARRRMRRLDHSMIFLLIAGSYTPVAVLVLSGPIATGVLVAVWTGALAGVAMKLLWIDAPKWLV